MAARLIINSRSAFDAVDGSPPPRGIIAGLELEES